MTARKNWVIPVVCGGMLLGMSALVSGSELTAGPAENEGQWKVIIRPMSDQPTKEESLPRRDTAIKQLQFVTVQEAGDAEDNAPVPAPMEPELEEAPAPGSPLPQFDSLAVRHAYSAVYFGIPFLRTEYEANPSYRHEATMEILFGHLRPTYIYKTQPGIVVRPYDPRGLVKNRLPYYTDGYNTNYNFFFRRRSIYRNY